MDIRKEINQFHKTLPDYTEAAIQAFTYRKEKYIAISIIQCKKSAPPGTGTALLEKICEIADHQQRVLTVEPCGKNKANGEWKNTTSKKRLIQFYNRFGFEKTSSRQMCRNPQTPQNEHTSR